MVFACLGSGDSWSGHQRLDGLSEDIQVRRVAVHAAVHGKVSIFSVLYCLLFHGDLCPNLFPYLSPQCLEYYNRPYSYSNEA